METRWQHIPAIRDELVGFAKHGYKYKESDLRWRHVLLDSDNKIFLCDLESLEKSEESEQIKQSHDVVVYEQLAILLNAMREEEDRPKEMENATLQWLQSNPLDVVSFICGNETLQSFFEGLNQGGDAAATTTQFADILLELFPQSATRESLPPKSKAAVTLRLLSHYRSAQSAKRQRSPTVESQTSVPGLAQSRSYDEATDASKRAKKI